MIKNKRALAAFMSGILFFLSACTLGNDVIVDNGKDDNLSHANIVDSQEININTEDNDIESDASNDQASIAPMETVYHVAHDGYIYFREYSFDDLSTPVFPYFGTTMTYNNTQKDHVLYRMDEKGDTEVFIENDPGIGEMAVAGGKLFGQRKVYEGEYSSYEVYYYDLENGNTYNDTDECFGLIASYNDYVLMKKGELDEYHNFTSSYIDMYDAKDMSLICTCSGSNYLGADDDGVYTCNSNYDYETGEANFCLYMSDYSGNEKMLLKLETKDFEDVYFDWGAAEAVCFQTTKEYVLVNIGIYAGTGHFFQNGRIFAIKKDGSESRVVNEEALNEDFYCIEKDGSLSVIVSVYDYDLDTYETISYQVEGETLEMIGYASEVMKQPRVYGDYDKVTESGETFTSGDVAVYPDASGQIYGLIEAEDYAGEGFDGYGYVSDDYENCDINTMVNIEYVDGKVFFTMCTLARMPEEDIGWRYAYKYTSVKEFVKDLNTGETKVLFEY